MEYIELLRRLVEIGVDLKKLEFLRRYANEIEWEVGEAWEQRLAKSSHNLRSPQPARDFVAAKSTLA